MSDPAGYLRAMLRYCSGQSRQPYPDAPEPLGATYGLSRGEAERVAREVHDAILAAGGTPRPVCRPMRPCDEARLINAYVRRGLPA